MAKRKTVNIIDLRIKVNDMIRLSTCSKDVRRGMIAVLETMLLDTGNYNGFRYLEADEVPEGSQPGIVRTDDGNIFPDDSRVEYYGKFHK